MARWASFRGPCYTRRKVLPMSPNARHPCLRSKQDTLQALPQLGPAHAPTVAKAPLLRIHQVDTSLFNRLDLSIDLVDSFPALVEHQRHPARDGNVAEEFTAKPHRAIPAKVFDQGADDRAVDFAHLADGVPETEHVAIDAVAQPGSFPNQLVPLDGQDPQLLDRIRGHPRLTPKTVETVLGQLWGVEAIGLSPDVAGIGRIDHGRTAPPCQAQRHVILARGFAGVAKLAGDDVDAMFPQNTQDPRAGRVQLVPERRDLLLKPAVFPTVGNQNADLEKTRMAVDAHAVRIELLARLFLPTEDGGGQQFSCRCCVRHGQLESPKAQDSRSSLDGLRDPLVLWECYRLAKTLALP